MEYIFYFMKKEKQNGLFLLEVGTGYEPQRRPTQGNKSIRLLFNSRTSFCRAARKFSLFELFFLSDFLNMCNKTKKKID